MKKVSLAAAGVILSLGCLPEDTRPTPSTIYTEFAMAAHSDSDLEDGLTLTTDDGYEVTFRQILLTLGRVTFTGDECNAYSLQDLGGFYSRVMDALQPGEQPVAKSYAIGKCEMGFKMSPPEDWAHVDNPGVSEADRDSLRAVKFPGQPMVDEFSGPRGSQGVSLRLVGQGRRIDSDDAPVEFLFNFPTQASAPLCAPEGQEFFELTGDRELTTVIEMSPEKLLGTCGDNSELRFAGIAAAQPAGSSDPVTLAHLRDVKLVDLAESERDEFYVCDRGLDTEDQPENDDMNDSQPGPDFTLRRWLGFRAGYDLFGVRDAECRIDRDADVILGPAQAD